MPQVIPTNQTSSLSPYTGKLFEFNNSDSRVYVSRAINSLLNMYGNNIIIDGFIPSNISMAGPTVHATISAGIAIADQTLLETTVSTTVSYDTTGLVTANASIAIFLDFQYLQQFASNPFVMRTQFIQANATTLPSDTLDLSRSRILIASIDFDAAGTSVTLHPSPSYDVSAMASAVNLKTIDGTAFKIHPHSTISDSFSRVVRDTFL